MENLLWQIPSVLLIGMSASFVQRVSGFGSGIFAMLFLPYIFENTAAAAAIACLWSLCTTVYNSIKHRKDIDFKLILPLLCAAFVTIPIAVSMAKYVPERTLKAILGIVLMILSIYFLFFSKKAKMKASVGNGIISGGIGGMLTGLFATGGPPVVLYLVNATTDKAVYFACIQTYFALTNAYATGIRAINGILDANIFMWAAVGIVGCLIGDTLGAKLFKKLNTERVKQIIYIGMIISGILMVV